MQRSEPRAWFQPLTGEMPAVLKQPPKRLVGRTAREKSQAWCSCSCRPCMELQTMHEGCRPFMWLQTFTQL